LRKKKSKRFVIDASVARSAGKRKSIDPVASTCRDFLQKALDICYRVVMNKKISDEWDEHQSQFALKWRATMKAKKKIVSLSQVSHKRLREKIKKATSDVREYEAMKKDLHLIRSALATDKIIISRDNEARECYSKIRDEVIELTSLIWVDPTRSNEQAIEWLENGAKFEKKRLLGSNNSTIHNP